MSKKVYIGVGNNSRNVSKIYIGISSKARKVLKGYIGINGKARQFFPSILIPDYTFGTTSVGHSGLWDSIVFGLGMFIAVDRDSATAVRSTTGTSWTKMTVPNGGHICFANNRFVIVGESAACYSTDGINWTKATSGISWLSKMGPVQYFNGKFITVGAMASNTTSGIVMYESTTGASWSRSSSNEIGGLYSSFNLIANNNWCLVPKTISTNNPGFAASRDLLSWTLYPGYSNISSLGDNFVANVDCLYGGTGCMELLDSNLSHSSLLRLPGNPDKTLTKNSYKVNNNDVVLYVRASINVLYIIAGIEGVYKGFSLPSGLAGGWGSAAHGNNRWVITTGNTAGTGTPGSMFVYTN